MQPPIGARVRDGHRRILRLDLRTNDPESLETVWETAMGRIDLESVDFRTFLDTAIPVHYPVALRVNQRFRNLRRTIQMDAADGCSITGTAVARFVKTPGHQSEDFDVRIRVLKRVLYWRS